MIKPLVHHLNNSNMSSKTAKPRKRGVQLSPAEEARARAATIVKLRQEKSELESAIEREENLLRIWVAETGEKVIGPLMAYERLNPPKLEGATGKTLEAHQEQLGNQFPDYIQRKLDLSKMMAAWDTDFNLRNAFSTRGLTITRESKWYFKIVEE